MTAAPDAAGPILAWRSWLVVDTDAGPRLHSTARAELWQPQRPVTAACRPAARLVPWPRRAPHASPDASCTCGVHAAADLAGALGALDPYARLGWKVRHRIVGQVALWGRVVECTHGWRAEHAYPALLVVPRRRLHDAPVPDADAIAAALAAYAVPVTTVDAGTRESVHPAIKAAMAGSQDGGAAG